MPAAVATAVIVVVAPRERSISLTPVALSARLFRSLSDEGGGMQGRLQAS